LCCWYRSPRRSHYAVAVATTVAIASAAVLTLAGGNPPALRITDCTTVREISMTASSAFTPVRADELSRCVAAVAQVLPQSWHDALGDWLETLLRPRGNDDPQRLNDRPLRDSGLTRHEIGSVQAEPAGHAMRTFARD
jgi:hypothetical protein